MAYCQNTIQDLYSGHFKNSYGVEGYDILVGEEFSCLEFYMDRDTISWILNN